MAPTDASTIAAAAAKRWRDAWRSGARDAKRNAARCTRHGAADAMSTDVDVSLLISDALLKSDASATNEYTTHRSDVLCPNTLNAVILSISYTDGLLALLSLYYC